MSTRLVFSVPWVCPLCQHENEQSEITAPDFVAYCNDAVDFGCGAGPFVVSWHVVSEARKVDGVTYSDPPGGPE